MSCEAEVLDVYFNLSGVADNDGFHVEDYLASGISSDRALVRVFLRDSFRGALGRTKATEIMKWISGRENKLQVSKDFGPYTVTYNRPMTNGQVQVLAD